jgi:hypothetical protein
MRCSSVGRDLFPCAGLIIVQLELRLSHAKRSASASRMRLVQGCAPARRRRKQKRRRWKLQRAVRLGSAGAVFLEERQRRLCFLVPRGLCFWISDDFIFSFHFPEISASRVPGDFRPRARSDPHPLCGCGGCSGCAPARRRHKQKRRRIFRMKSASPVFFSSPIPLFLDLLDLRRFYF